MITVTKTARYTPGQAVEAINAMEDLGWRVEILTEIQTWVFVVYAKEQK